MSSVSSDSRWTCRHRSSMLQSWHLQLHLLKITCSGKLWGIKFSTLMLKTRTVSAQTDASDNSLMGGSSWASNCNFESECKADYLQSARMRWSNELKFSVLYMTHKYLDAVHKWSGQLGTLAHEFVATRCVRCSSVNQDCCMWQDICLLYQFPLSI